MRERLVGSWFTVRLEDYLDEHQREQLARLLAQTCDAGAYLHVTFVGGRSGVARMPFRLELAQGQIGRKKRSA